MVMVFALREGLGMELRKHDCDLEVGRILRLGAKSSPLRVFWTKRGINNLSWTSRDAG
jgi:hypothetical protein